MFNWLGNLFPYSDLHSLNLDWILSKMKETAAQAAKAIADSANALAQVIEAKTAAQNAQTAAQNAQTAANNAQVAANNAADSAENAVNVAQAAKSTAQAAQSAAQTAKTAADNALSKFPVKREDIADYAIGSKQIENQAVSVDKIMDYSVTTNKIKNGAVTNAKMSQADFYVGIGSFSITETATAAAIAAGQAVFGFSSTDTKTVIFVAYAGNDYNDGDTPHHLFMYSDPFIINRLTPTKRVVDITLEDFNNQTGEHTEYKGTLTISISTSTPRRVTGKIAFAETLPFSDAIAIPYGIKGLGARPIV